MRPQKLDVQSQERTKRRKRTKYFEKSAKTRHRMRRSKAKPTLGIETRSVFFKRKTNMNILYKIGA
jgi:hypothetical protein